VSAFPFVYSAIYRERLDVVLCVCCNSLVVLQQNEARGKKKSEQTSGDWLASRVDRLNSIAQVIITVLLNTSIAVECICLALLSGSVLFESFIHLGCFLSFYHIYIYMYKPYLLSIHFFFSRVAYTCTGATIVVGRRQQQASLEFALLFIVGSDDGSSSLRHVNGAVIVI
jgi:hypothetical protein